MRPIAHIITESEPFGGAQRNTLLTLKGLVGDRYQLELICGPGGPLIQEAEAIGVRVHVVESLLRPVQPWKDLQAFLRLWSLCRRRRYDIVHTHSTKAGLLGRLAAWCAGVPIIIHTVHGVPFLIDKSLRSRVYLLLERLVAQVTDCVVCVGEVLRQELLAWKIAPGEKLTTIHSGLDFSSYVPTRSPPEARRQFGVEQAWPVIGCIGRLSEAKAQAYLVQAIDLLKEKYPGIRLLLVGEGKQRPSLEKLIRQSGLFRHVFLLGERDDITDFLNALDIYAMSSQWEGVGRALSEAMYWELPIVATPVNGVKEIVIHEETGLLVAPRDSRGLSSAIDRLAADRELARRLGSNAGKKARELMDGRRMIASLEELYGRLSWAASACPRPAHFRGLGRKLKTP